MEAGAKAAEVLGRARHADGEAMAAREQTWDECGIEQKINRLRSVLLTLSHQGQHAGRDAQEALKIAKAHQHGGQGQVVLPVIESVGNLIEREYSQHPFENVRRMLG